MKAFNMSLCLVSLCLFLIGGFFDNYYLVTGAMGVMYSVVISFMFEEEKLNNEKNNTVETRNDNDTSV